jgi:hypothetical protein
MFEASWEGFSVEARVARQTAALASVGPQTGLTCGRVRHRTGQVGGPEMFRL